MQIDRSALGIIRIIDVPEGEDPEEIRAEWIGVEVPCLFLIGEEDDSREYIVLQEWAISALAVVAPKAAKYWNDNGYPKEDGATFNFNTTCAKVLKPVMGRAEFKRRFILNS